MEVLLPSLAPIQVRHVTLNSLPRKGHLFALMHQKDVAIACPLAMIGMCQIIFGALPTMFSERAQWRKPLWILSVLSALFYLASIVIVVDGQRVFYIDWQQTIAVDSTAPSSFADTMMAPNMLGWYYKRSAVGNAWTWSYPIFVSAGQIFYEMVAAFRTCTVYRTEKGKTRLLYVVTALSCVCHFVVSWTISLYGAVQGSEKWMSHQDKFSKAGVADVTFGVAIESK
ncbi:hypothetical protein HDU86_003258 [Geranomyces michiganensis]|nr:hypothetical protein HDU86_003258 [Geranomyces michiganensis]